MNNRPPPDRWERLAAEDRLKLNQRNQRYRLLLRRVIVWGVFAAVVYLCVTSTMQTLSYSSVCTRCLATRSGVDRSILGIVYAENFERILYLYETAETPRPAEYAEGRQTLYEQIHGKACEHDFARTGFCRYRYGSVGCGHSGGSYEVWNRKKLVLGAFGAFERISDQDLAVRTCQLIERDFPHARPQRSGGQNLVKDSQDPVEQYRRRSVFEDLLGLVQNKEEWAAVLDYVEGGIQGDPPLLLEVQAVIEQLESGKPVENVTAASILAMRTSTSNELLKRMMKCGNREVVSTTKFLVIQEKRLELFGLVLEGYNLNDEQELEMRKYSSEDFGRLFALGDETVDKLCEDAIWFAYTDHFMLLDPMLAALNRHDSPQARETIGKLLWGGNPYSRGGIPRNRSSVYDPEHMWNEIKTLNAPIETLLETITVCLGDLPSQYRMNFHEAIKSIGNTGDRKHWEFLKKSYLMCLEKKAHSWHSAVFGRAMHQLDAQATENFLIGELRAGRGGAGVISAMGFIGSRKFQPALEEFAAGPRPIVRLEDELPKNYYDTDGDGTALIAYALHRCSGIPSWKLVKNGEGRYVIDKTLEISR